MGEDKVFVVGHDWGAIIVWQFCLFRPDKVKVEVNSKIASVQGDDSESWVLIPETTFVGVESRVLIPETTFVGVESRVLIPETTVWDTLVYPSDTLVIHTNSTDVVKVPNEGNEGNEPVMTMTNDEVYNGDQNDDVINGGGGESANRNREEFCARDTDFPSLNNTTKYNSTDNTSKGMNVDDEVIPDNARTENIDSTGRNGMNDDLTSQNLCDNNDNECNMDNAGHKSYAKVTKPDANEDDNKLSLIPMCIEDGREVVVFDEEIVMEGSRKWALTLCGHFVGCKMSYSELRYNLVRMCGKFGLREIITQSRVFLFKFRESEGMSYVLENGPWMVSNKPLMVQKWEPDVIIDRSEPKTLPCWIKLHKVPFEAWIIKGISAIASGLVTQSSDQRCGTHNGTDNDKGKDIGNERNNRPMDGNGYIKNHKKTVKNGRARTQERKSEQKSEAKARKSQIYSQLQQGNKTVQTRVEYRPVVKEQVEKMVNQTPVQVSKDRNSKEIDENGDQESLIQTGREIDNCPDEEDVFDDMIGIKLGKFPMTNMNAELRVAAWNVRVTGVGILKRIVDDNPWVLIGDWNVSLHLEDHSEGGSSKTRDMIKLQECLENTEVEDLNSSGVHFTWVQSRQNPISGILKKINRVLVLIIPKMMKMKHKAFRFINFIDDKPNFLSNVQDEWNIQVEGCCKYRLVKNLKAIKFHLKKLSWQYGNIFEKVIKWREKLQEIQKKVDQNRHDAELKKDRNSKYFHTVLKGRAHKSRIDVVSNETEDRFEGSQIADQFVKHFKNLLGRKVDVQSMDLESLNCQTVGDDVEYMIISVTGLEIKDALFDICDNKAPGPDGYSTKFYKSAWTVIGKEVYEVVKEFFRNREMLGEVNATRITLVPKSKTPMKVSDYRPIACCNVIYKVISKILTNRIKNALTRIVNPSQSAFIPGRQITDNILLTQELLRGYNWKNGAKRVALKIDIQKSYDTEN
ncbi:RNA-directed DNA polymerase, eukaryota, reverse transcriptase zinc-binding domain protein [Tanacetum coccineum]